MAKTILITGASSGLGEEMARQFGALGYDLALCARRTDRLEDLAAEITRARPDARVEVRALDVRDSDAVFEVFRDVHRTFGHLDRVIVNAGLGKGAPLGTGKFYANKQTAETNFIGALAQVEAALEVFRQQQDGHLVMVSSMSAMRGAPKNITTYAATKAAVAHLMEGVRVELWDSPIRFTTVYPGYIESEMTSRSGSTPFIVGTEKGVAAIVAAIEKEKPSARVPAWPWQPLGYALKHLPLGLARRLM
jgi:NADP-dependent 3-hydroxy acid dehydrogenase YdfG